MDLDSAADELYGVSPEDFVARRKELVARARQAKDRELVRQIGELRKPTRTGWLVNVLARTEPERVSELLALGHALADAQQRSSGPDLRRLSAQRRTLVDALARRSLELGRELGYQAPDAAHQEVAQTLQSALGDQKVAELLHRGRLTQAASYGGFGMGDLSGALAASLPDPPAEPEAELEPGPDPEAVRRARETQEVADRARHELADAETVAEQATARADELADRVAELSSQLAESETAERTARDDARAARKRVTELRRAAEAADRAVAVAAADLAG